MDWGRGSWTPGFGADFKAQLIKDMGPWTFWSGGFGECLPNPDNLVELDPTVKDKWGIPALRISVAYGPNEKAMTKDMAITCAEMLEAAGATNVDPYDAGAAPGLCIHEMGTARMGRDPKTSVLNSWNQAHEVPNLFVTDGACMASSACQNPSITYMALTARAAAHAVGELKRRSL